MKLTDFHIWQWEDEHSTWQTYSADSVLYLEKANQENDTSVSFKAYGRDYTVDLSSMQQSNDATGVSRNVARIKSGEFHYCVSADPLSSQLPTKSS